MQNMTALLSNDQVPLAAEAYVVKPKLFINGGSSVTTKTFPKDEVVVR